MSSDAFIRFVEDNFDALAEKFVDKHIKEWDDFVFDEYANSCQEPYFEQEDDL